MKIPLSDLKPQIDLTLTGDEDWLQPLYADFPADAVVETPRLTGSVTVIHELAGTVIARGTINYEPIVGCSRCGKPITWPLSLKFSLRFYKPGDDELEDREQTVSSGQLDDYWIENDEVDIGQVIHDQVHTAIPSRTIAYADDDKSCRICMTDLSEALVFGPGEQEPESPFAVLADKKWKN